MFLHQLWVIQISLSRKAIYFGAVGEVRCMDFDADGGRLAIGMGQMVFITTGVSGVGILLHLILTVVAS